MTSVRFTHIGGPTVLIEVAALNQRLRSQGYFSAESFNQRLIERMKTKSSA